MMIIAAFVFNNDDTARQVSINAVRGAFRFITGKSSKDAYSITTPTATIGVRGIVRPEIQAVVRTNEIAVATTLKGIVRALPARCRKRIVARADRSRTPMIHSIG